MNFMNISAATKLTAVVGNPVKYSLSPLLHNAIYANEGIDAVMLAFENSDIEVLVGAMRALPVHLSAVTIPHKQTVIPLLDEVDGAAREIGAVNTVMNTGGTLKGFNTDVVGIARALEGVALSGKEVLVLGAGGAAHAVSYHLKKSGARMHVVDRTIEKARALCDVFGGTAIAEPSQADTPFDVIINATPVGLAPNADATPVPADIIRSGSTVFDLVYSPIETRLMREAKARGARAISGLAMFLAQGLEQERLWLGKEIRGAEYATLLESQLSRR